MIETSSWIFDENYFVDPITGVFRFPKYSYTGEYLVEIYDETDYAQLFWEFPDLTPEEINRYGIADFEIDLKNAETFDLDIAVDTVGEFIQNEPEEIFNQYPELMEFKDHLAKLVYEFGSGDAWYGSFNEGFRKTLIECGLSRKYEPYMKGTREWGYLFDKICLLYVQSLKVNLERFHPLYISKIFQEILDRSDAYYDWVDDDSFINTLGEYIWWEKVPALIVNELKSQYWLGFQRKRGNDR